MVRAYRDLSPLFDFSSVAFVGASDSTNFGLGAFKALREVGFRGDYFPINPKRAEVHGTTAYSSVANIPSNISAAVIAVGRQQVLPAFEQAADKGARAIVVLSGNFAEGDDEGRALQKQLSTMARERGVILIGPNCMGAASVKNRCALYQGRGLEDAIKGGISVVSNSGGLMNEFLHYGNARGLGFCNLVSSGNEADVTCAEVIHHYVDDPDTEVIVAIVETVRDPELFVAGLERAAQSRKPVLLLKLGSSEKGAKSAVTHTGALAGNDRVWDALLTQKAVTRASDIDELVDLAAVFGPARKVLAYRSLERAGVIEISGGGCELVCDVAEAAGLGLPEPTAAMVETMKPVMQEFLTPSNPLDIGLLWVNPAMGKIYPVALEAFAAQDDIDIVVSRYIVPPEGEMGELHNRLTELDAARVAHPDRLFAVVSPTSNKYQPEWRDAIRSHNLVFVPGFRRGFSALGKLAHYSRLIRTYLPKSGTVTLGAAAVATDLATVLNEVESKRLLTDAGLPVPRAILVRSVEEAVAESDALTFPLVAKLMSPQFVHKSDAGGVRLNIRSVIELKNTFNVLRDLTKTVAGAIFEGVSIQSMAPPGVELVLGAHRDPQFGPVLMCGLGGIFIEILKDTVLRVAPISEEDAADMLNRLSGAAILDGARGTKPVDKNAVASALWKLSELMMARPDIESIDINPAFAYPDGLQVIDARVVLSESKTCVERGKEFAA